MFHLFHQISSINIAAFSVLTYLKEHIKNYKPHHMPYKCSHCGEFFSATCSLKSHQKSARYCLDIQKRNGLDPKYEEYRCECGNTFTLKGNFTKHKVRCNFIRSSENTDEKTPTQIAVNQGTINNTINHINNNTVNNTIILADSGPFTIHKLTEDYIISKLTPVITKEVMKSGINSITELIIELLLINDGKYCYWCTDKSRKQFKMLISSDGEVSVKDDPNAVSLRTIMSIPLRLITLPLVSNKNTPKAMIATYDEIKKIDKEGSEFMTALASALPRTPDGLDPQTKAIADANRSPANLKKIEELEAKLEFNKKRRALLDSGASEEDIPWILSQNL
jgi:hypothetical protein